MAWRVLFVFCFGFVCLFVFFFNFNSIDECMYIFFWFSLYVITWNSSKWALNYMFRALIFLPLYTHMYYVFFLGTFSISTEVDDRRVSEGDSSISITITRMAFLDRAATVGKILFFPQLCKMVIFSLWFFPSN